MISAKRTGWLLGVMAAVLVTAAAAQTPPTGTVSGTVRSASGAPVAAARVAVASRSSSAYTGTATTDDAGSFTVADVPVGSVMLTVYNGEARVIARGNGVIAASGETITVALRTP